MQPTSGERFSGIVNMAKALRREHLFILHEQNCFASLHEEYDQNSCEALQISWTCARQRQILNNLILAKPESGPSVSCQRVKLLENSYFIHIHQCRFIKYPQIVGTIELLNYLYANPTVLANILSFADRCGITQDKTDPVITFIVNGLYRSAMYPKDAEMVIKVLQVLIETQIAKSDNPRRLLRVGSSSFTRLYQKYHESTFAPKIFLKAILFEPIMSVLTDDERKWEVDPLKIISVQSASENEKMFGEESSPEYLKNLQRYRKDTVDRLYTHVSNFIKSFSDNWCLFPSTLRWLCQSMNHLLKPANLSKEDIHIILTDLIFTNFICPAILSPNIHGITDAPLSENTRFNLVQIGQVIQTLALFEIQPIDDKLKDLYDKFENNCIRVLLNQLHYESFSKSFESNNKLQYQNLLNNKLVLASNDELKTLISLLKETMEHEIEAFSPEESCKLKQIVDQLPNLTEINQHTATSMIDSVLPNYTKKTKSTIKPQVSKSKSMNTSPTQMNSGVENIPNPCNNNNVAEVVLIIPLAMKEGKMLNEDEFINNMSDEISTTPLQINFKEDHNTLESGRKNDGDKLNNYSLAQDDASIGNTSDNLEAVSEAHSNHSVASSLELEETDQNDNDNLSDMISANVSGRGTPNISGRDTPSSQVTEGGGEAQHFTTPQMTKILNKTRSDIEDKFCKFEIKKLMEGDETISIISDTWSTDVLASDSEPIEVSERNFSTPLIPTTPLMPGDHNYNPITNSFGQMRLNNVDSETQSESAWSTDAVMDTDDNSVTTRSDIAESVVRDRDLQIVSRNNSLDSSLYCPKTLSFRGSHTSLLQNSYNDNGVTNCLHPIVLPVRQSSTESYHSTNGSEHNKPSNGSGMNEHNIQNNTIETMGYLESHTSTDTNCNIAECVDSNDSATAIDVNHKNGCVHASMKSTNPFSDLDCIFPSSNNNNNKNNNNNNNNHLSSTSILQHTLDYVPNNGDEELSVEHRRLSSEQRNAKFDSRRNGMIDILGNFSNSFSFSQLRDKDISYSLPITSLKLPDDFKTGGASSMVVESSSFLSNRASNCLKIVNKQSHANFNSAEVIGTEKQRQQDSELKQSCSNTSASKYNAKATGTIPKSISFDSSADKTNRNDSAVNSPPGASRFSDGLKTNPGFFTKIKLGFKNRRNVSVNNKSRFSYTNNGQICAVSVPHNNGMDCTNDTSEDILAKYRRKTSTSSDAATTDTTSKMFSSSKSKNGDCDLRKSLEQTSTENSVSLSTIKRKLRVILSSMEVFSCDFENFDTDSSTPLLIYLRILQAQALNNNNLQQLAGVSELFRCIQSIDMESQEVLLKELHNDILVRKSYIQYLMDCRQTLLSAIDNVETLKEHLKLDSQLSIHHIIMTCVNMFLDKREQSVQKFHNEFVQLTVADEKNDLLHVFLKTLMDELRTDTVLRCMTEWQTSEAENCAESILLHRLYQFVMFPNDDGDISRDLVLYVHINKLSKSITPDHSQLRISGTYLNEAPWPFAQRQLSFISAYRTPQDKVNCVIKCIKSLLSLLSIGSEKPVAADDIIPVLIYVIVKTNPPHLLSTIEYVNCFIGEKLFGENEYWWTQFCSAITFIKTMDYSE
ncbi:receptor-mediated endocytosis protein 6 homolog [Ochlerotatus camptorhynchus]|uniref:receptor-mediated endocytosis protein 6 homolog n=1 Tax=Ochlerotatus camptorhynchus TaxID=644619 RepID=UPI0031E166C7